MLLRVVKICRPSVIDAKKKVGFYPHLKLVSEIRRPQAQRIVQKEKCGRGPVAYLVQCLDNIGLLYPQCLSKWNTSLGTRAITAVMSCPGVH